MHVLIVEDDLDLGPALLSSLRQEGVTGVWVRHCADAVAHLEASGEPPPDALLLDLLLGLAGCTPATAARAGGRDFLRRYFPLSVTVGWNQGIAYRPPQRAGAQVSRSASVSAELSQ